MISTNSGIEAGIERHRDQMPVGHREHDENQAQRYQNQSGEELSHGGRSYLIQIGRRIMRGRGDGLCPPHSLF
jgi:hypothetical protein